MRLLPQQGSPLGYAGSPVGHPRRAAGSCRAWIRIAPLLLAAGAAAAAEPFEVRTLRVEGRPLGMVPAAWGDCAPGASGWAAISVLGSPPEERRQLSFFPCGPRPEGPSHRLELTPEVVAFDLADALPSPGAELVLLSARSLTVLRPLDGTRLAELPLPESVPLPPRLRDASQAELVGPWNGDGRPAAVVPTRSGARVVDLASGTSREIDLPLLAEYTTADARPPARGALLTAWIHWPALTLADDDGDGRPDLFAASRYEVRVFRSGPEGLPTRASRVVPIRPFTPDEELRPETTAFRNRVQDVDGDGRADLVLDSGAGTLLRSRHETRVHLNPGDGIAAGGPPSIRLELEDAIAEVWAEDLDGDGRCEILRGALSFGLLQAVNILIRKRIGFDLDVHSLDEDGRWVRSWQGEHSVALDFQGGRVGEVVPSTDGDWNGDGRRDLLLGDGPGAVIFRLGRAEAGGPGFGSRVGRQEIPESNQAEVLDLDGDGLDDLLLFDARDREGHIHVLHNRGTLPGTRPGLRAAQRSP